MTRFALCDDDQLYTRMIELMLADLGHEVVGVARSTADSIGLLESARPDAVILDLSLGFNHDFDVVATATRVEARVIVFSHTADEAILSKYDPRPVVVPKPDLTELEQVVRRFTTDSDTAGGTGTGVTSGERRVRPMRVAGGRIPTGVGDAQAFYEALNEAVAGDALLSIEVPNTDASWRDTSALAAKVRQVMRDTDRLLASAWSVRVFLPGGDDVGAAALGARLVDADALPNEAVVRSVVVGVDEEPAAAFDRLRSMGQER